MSQAAVRRVAVALTQNPVALVSRLCHVSSSRVMLRPGPMTALGLLAAVGNKQARAAEAGINAFPWPKEEGPWDAVHGPPALGFLRYVSEAHVCGGTGYMTGRVREDWQLLNK